MSFFLTGTDTDVGKTLIASWICLHSGYDYWKPIQSGNENKDTDLVTQLSSAHCFSEEFVFEKPLSPHVAAQYENKSIALEALNLPSSSKLIVEGAGGVLVPLNASYFVADLICHFNLPVILVSRSGLGTINHTCLTLEALRARNISVAGVIMNGEENPLNKAAIEHYGKTTVLAEFPRLQKISMDDLKDIPLPPHLRAIL